MSIDTQKEFSKLYSLYAVECDFLYHYYYYYLGKGMGESPTGIDKHIDVTSMLLSNLSSAKSCVVQRYYRANFLIQVKQRYPRLPYNYIYFEST